MIAVMLYSFMCKEQELHVFAIYSLINILTQNAVLWTPRVVSREAVTVCLTLSSDAQAYSSEGSMPVCCIFIRFWNISNFPQKHRWSFE